MKNFDEGFKEYEYRIYEDKNFKSLINRKNSIWKGENLENKTILVVAEDGFGNTIQFSRYLETLSQLNGKIVFKCQDELHHLFEDLTFIDEIISLDNQYDSFDYWIPLQNLIYLLTPDLDSNCPSPTL